MCARRWATALVTGASSGIGRAFARRLSAEGTELVLVARDVARLEALKLELSGPGRAQVELMPADLSDRVQLARVESRLAELDRPIELLVNNAGFGTAGRFWELPVEREIEELSVNVRAVVRLSHAALGAMVARNKGNVINVASVAGMLSWPGTATYGASKAYLNSFGDSVHEELAGTGVALTTLLPGFTRTEFQARIEGPARPELRVPNWMWLTPEDVVRSALKAAAAGRARAVPGVVYKVASALLDSIPSSLIRRSTGTADRRS